MAGRWLALAVVFATRTSMGFQFQGVASVAPPLVTELGLSYAQLGTLIGLYMLPGMVFALPGGMLGARFGERRTVAVSLGLMTLGCLLTAASSTFLPAAVGRLVSGAGAVLMNMLLAKMVADWFAGQELATAMAVMLTAWPVGLGLATATLGAVAEQSSWRWAIVVTALAAAVGMALMTLVYRDAPRRTTPETRGQRLSGREVALAMTAGLAWGCFNASLVTIVAFGPALLVARGASLADAGFVVSLAIWLTIVSVPLGGMLSDRTGRPSLLIVGGTIAAAVTAVFLPAFALPWLGFALVGVMVGGPPGPIMALLPKALPPERLATGFGILYTVFYACMTLTQPLAGLLRDRARDPATPILFAAFVLAGTLAAFALFRLLARAPARRPLTAPAAAPPEA